jgi:hypothetical protein
VRTKKCETQKTEAQRDGIAEKNDVLTFRFVRSPFAFFVFAFVVRGSLVQPVGRWPDGT